MDEQSAAGKGAIERGPSREAIWQAGGRRRGRAPVNLDAVYEQGIDLVCRFAASPCLSTGRSVRKKPQPTSSALARQLLDPTTLAVSKTYLFISCGGIVPVWRLRQQKQELFRRNFRNGHTRLVAMGL